MTDYTRTADSLIAQDMIADDRSYASIRITAVERENGYTTILGRLHGDGAVKHRVVTRVFHDDDRVTVRQAATAHGPTATEQALVVVEVVERILRSIDGCLRDFDGSDRAQVEQARTFGREAIDLLAERTTTLTTSLVKSQPLSDRISHAAGPTVVAVLDKAGQAMLATRVS